MTPQALIKLLNHRCDLCAALQVITESMKMLSCIGGRSGEIVISTNGHKMCQRAQNEDECTRRCIPWPLLVYMTQGGCWRRFVVVGPSVAEGAWGEMWPSWSLFLFL